MSFDSQVNSMDALRYSLREQILFRQVCDIRLSPGLYLAYLQALSSIDSLRVIASSTLPSAPPYVRLRENPHVTCEEWSWVRKMGSVLSAGGDGGFEESSMQMPSPTTNFLANESEDGTEQHLVSFFVNLGLIAFLGKMSVK